MPDLVFYLLVFLAVGTFFLFIHLLMGHYIRPSKPEEDKLTVYECGEPTVGSAWVQFDLRYYVVALLFVIFDVEVVFFFPWAVVFGKANQVANPSLSVHERNILAKEMFPRALDRQDRRDNPPLRVEAGTEVELIQPEAAAKFAWLTFLDIFVFFFVLLVGFAYLWRRGDLDWVRSTLAEDASAVAP